MLHLTEYRLAIGYLLWIPAWYFLLRGVNAGWKLVDEVNRAAPILETHYRRWSWDPVRAWKKHESLFPEKVAERSHIRNLYFISLALAACAFVLQVWIGNAK